MTYFWTYEWIVIAYFLYLIVTATIIPAATLSRRARVAFSSIAVIATIGGVAASGGLWAQSVRPWLPLFYLVAAYRLPLHLVTRGNAPFERALVGSERGWLGMLPRKVRMHAPTFVLDYLECTYLFCYPLIPLGFLTLTLAGRTDLDTNRFWMTVLAATLPCYATLPWLPTRPPRLLESAGTGAVSRIGATNIYVLDKVSVGWNTFPSGHAAASVATALALGVHITLAGVMFGIIAVSICIGSITGRYHYTVDAISGIVLAGAAFAVAHFR
jgi:hypothetical protein